VRVALIADIHGNAVALDAVLACLKADDPDHIACLGDVAATGPDPSGVIKHLRHLDCPVAMGNWDEWLLQGGPGSVADNNSPWIKQIDYWSAAQLSPADLDYLQTFRPAVEIALGGEATLLCFHGSPHSNTDISVATTPEEDLDHMLSGCRATVLAGGHTGGRTRGRGRGLYRRFRPAANEA
jgi:predicted phosphodiesterase